MRAALDRFFTVAAANGLNLLCESARRNWNVKTFRQWVDERMQVK